ncbi:MAG: cell division protein ZapB [bacterium]|nr:cell division protein ZapB [bacterium]
MSTAFNKIDMLEKRVSKVLDIINELQAENARLVEENKKLKDSMAEHKGETQRTEKEYKAMKAKYDEVISSQDKVQGKIEDMLDNLDQIEKKLNSGGEEKAASPESESRGDAEAAMPEKEEEVTESEEVEINPFIDETREKDKAEDEEPPEEEDQEGGDEEKSLF